MFLFKQKKATEKKLMFFKVCSHFNEKFFKFNEISSSQSKEIFHNCCKINFASSIDGVKSPNGSKNKM